jgi:hypothetical protein
MDADVSTSQDDDEAMTELRRQFAAGEISEDEFERRREVLDGTDSRPDSREASDSDVAAAVGDDATAVGDRDAEAGWVTNEGYRDVETQNVQLSNGQRVRVERMEQLQFATLVERHDLGSVEAALDNVDGEVAIDDLEESLGSRDALKFLRFARDVIQGRVLKPEGAHWADPDADGFDLTTLGEADLVAVIAAIVGRDAADLRAAAEDRRQDRARRFRG